MGRRRIGASLAEIWRRCRLIRAAAERRARVVLTALRSMIEARRWKAPPPAPAAPPPSSLLGTTEPPSGVLGRVRLGTQLIVGLSVLALSVAATMGFIAWRAERAYLAEHLHYDHQRTFDFVRSPLLDDMMRNNRAGVEATMRQLVARDRQIYSVVLSDRSGTTLFAYKRGSERPEFVVPLRQPIEFLGEEFGLAVVEWDDSEVGSMVLRRAAMISLAVGSACIALGLLVFLFFQALVVRPIDGISRRILALQSGRFSHTLRLSGSASVELKRLNASVDALGEFLILKDRREAELREAKEMAEAGSRAKSEFLANVSHELRTPLNAINGFSELMLTEALGPLGAPHYKDYVKSIHDSGIHLLGIIDDILDMSNLEAGKFAIDVGDLDVARLVRGYVDSMRSSAEARRIALEATVDEKVPAIRADGRRVRQVLGHLLSNALKFTPEGGRVRVIVEPAEAGGVRVTVSDTGIGIPADKIQAVLGAFGQVESAFSRSRGGTGLGLTLANRFVALHGGMLTLAGAVGGGTEASFVLPARPPAGSDAETGEVQPAALVRTA